MGLSGDLGAGKTALTRATLRALDVSGPVKSPTFTLLEPYALSSINFYHFDFYRFSDPAEFAAAGFRELFGPAEVTHGATGRANVCFVEWPERATGTLPTIDLSLSLSIDAGDDAARHCRAQAGSTLGSACLESTISSFEAAAAELGKAAAGTLILALSPLHIARGATLLGVRVWPATDYTRITLEHDAELRFTHFVVRETPPLRLVVEIEGIELTPQLKELVGKVEADDPYISLVRVGQNRPRVVRLVVELKEDIKPQVFSLAPVGPYQHRLVLDLYPVVQRDPLARAAAGTAAPARVVTGADVAAVDASAAPSSTARELDRTATVREIEKPVPTAIDPAAPSLRTRRGRDNVSRFVTVAIDPGHGGEDPGAVGRRGTYEKHVTLSIARRIERLIESERGMRVMLTRDGDYFVPLGQRVAKARRVQADLFVSIHADAWIRPTRAARRCSRCPSVARARPRQPGWHARRTTPT